MRFQSELELAPVQERGDCPVRDFAGRRPAQAAAVLLVALAVALQADHLVALLADRLVGPLAARHEAVDHLALVPVVLLADQQVALSVALSAVRRAVVRAVPVVLSVDRSVGLLADPSDVRCGDPDLALRAVVVARRLVFCRYSEAHLSRRAEPAVRQLAVLSVVRRVFVARPVSEARPVAGHATVRPVAAADFAWAESVVADSVSAVESAVADFASVADYHAAASAVADSVLEVDYRAAAAFAVADSVLGADYRAAVASVAAEALASAAA